MPLIKLLQLLFVLAYLNQCYFPIFICLFLGKFRTKRDDKSSRFVLNSRWHLSKCILSVHSMFLDGKWAISSSQNMQIVPPFSTVLPKQLNLIARTSQSPSLFLAIPPYYWHCFLDIANIFRTWSMLAGYEELAMGFEPEQGEIFWMNNIN